MRHNARLLAGMDASSKKALFIREGGIMAEPFTDVDLIHLKAGAVAHCMKNEVGDWTTLVARLIATIDARDKEIDRLQRLKTAARDYAAQSRPMFYDPIAHE